MRAPGVCAQAEAHGSIFGYMPAALASTAAIAPNPKISTVVGHFHVVPYAGNLFVAHTGANRAYILTRTGR